MSAHIKSPYEIMSPTLVAISLCVVGFVGVMLVRILIEHDFYFLPYAGFWIGESIGIPVFGYFVAKAVQGHTLRDDALYSQAGLYVGLLIFGLVVGLINSNQTRASQGRSILIPSEIYQWGFSTPILTTIIVTGIILLVATRASVGNTAGATLGLGILFGSVVFDLR